MNQQSPNLIVIDHFGQLMELYELNYILIRGLFGDLKRLKTGDECLWHAAVSARVQSCERHTLEIHFIDQRQLDKKSRPMRIRVRICLDARTAELIGLSRREHCLKGEATQCIQKQLTQNKLLNIWLNAEIAHLHSA